MSILTKHYFQSIFHMYLLMISAAASSVWVGGWFGLSCLINSELLCCSSGVGPAEGMAGLSITAVHAG